MTTPISQDIQQAATYLMADEVVAIPTETVYGLAANALKKEAVEKIFLLKQRPSNNPLIVHTHSILEAEKYLGEIPVEIRQLAKHFSPGPITFLLPRKKNIPDIVCAGSNKVAIRIPQHPMTLALLRLLPFPLAAPSANRFTYLSPTNAQDVTTAMQCKLKFVLDGGPCNVGIESTIVEWKNNELIVHRYGAITIEHLRKVLPQAKIAQAKNELTEMLPGKSLTHYSPKTPLYIGDLQTLIQNNQHQRLGIVSFGKSFKAEYPNCVMFERILSSTDNLEEIAQHLYATLLELDQCGATMILSEQVEDIGIGRAINDRIQRAAHQHQPQI